MPSVLFVCTANRFRSPIAAALFLKALKDQGVKGSWSVGSAGTWAVSGQPVLTSVLEVAQDYGLDLSTHRSRHVDAQTRREPGYGGTQYLLVLGEGVLGTQRVDVCL